MSGAERCGAALPTAKERCVLPVVQTGVTPGSSRATVLRLCVFFSFGGGGMVLGDYSDDLCVVTVGLRKRFGGDERI